MIRGQRFFSLAVRRQDGSIYHAAEPLSSVYAGPLRKFPFVRGVLVLLETLILGFKVLTRSANIALEDRSEGEMEEISNWVMFLTLTISIGVGIIIFFLMPLFAARSLDSILDSAIGSGTRADITSNFIEGFLRLGLLVGYISLIGLMKDIRRVFSYHGAEHMTIHAHERGLPLSVDMIRPFSTAHPRCGTAFLLTVAVVAILVFSLLGRPDLHWAILSRVALIPVISGVSYEVIRLAGGHQESFLSKIISAPGMALQKLTTRRPDDAQIEVAIQAMETALAADQGKETPKENPQTQMSNGEMSIKGIEESKES